MVASRGYTDKLSHSTIKIGYTVSDALKFAAVINKRHNEIESVGGTLWPSRQRRKISALYSLGAMSLQGSITQVAFQMRPPDLSLFEVTYANIRASFSF